MYEPKYKIYIFAKGSCSTTLNNLNIFTKYVEQSLLELHTI